MGFTDGLTSANLFLPLPAARPLRCGIRSSYIHTGGQRNDSLTFCTLSQPKKPIFGSKV
jgi:hypothetical protein